MEYLGLHNKPKAEEYPGHKVTGHKEEEEDVHVCFYIIRVSYSCGQVWVCSLKFALNSLR